MSTASRLPASILPSSVMYASGREYLRWRRIWTILIQMKNESEFQKANTPENKEQTYTPPGKEQNNIKTDTERAGKNIQWKYNVAIQKMRKHKMKMLCDNTNIRRHTALTTLTLAHTRTRTAATCPPWSHCSRALDAAPPFSSRARAPRHASSCGRQTRALRPAESKR